MKNGNYVSDAVIRRLPRYYRYLGELLESGIERISSGELSRRMGLTASQVRQDFNHFGGFGQQGYGYNVETLRNELGHIMGIDEPHRAILVGAGHLGSALANYTNFAKKGFIIEAAFDKDPKVIGTKIGSLKVRSMGELERFIRHSRIELAVLAIPKADAREIASNLVDWGIRGIWNFASTDLRLDKNVVVENAHLSDSMMRFTFKLKHPR